jgi:signal transduction histidine kinase
MALDPVAAGGTQGLMQTAARGRKERAAHSARFKRRNVELEAHLAALTEANHRLERFVGEAAHEMTEPLVIAESCALMLKDELGEDVDPFLRARLDSLVSVAVRGRLLVESLLQDARSADRAPELANVDVGDLVDEVLLLVAESVSDRGQSVSVGTLPTLVTNPELLSIVLGNLVVNAVKHGAPRSEVRIDAERGHECWRISVVSPGRPITPSDAGRILHRFERGTTGSRSNRGAGMGLAICVRLAERLGGMIGVVPGPEAGNEFFISLPDRPPPRGA